MSEYFSLSDCDIIGFDLDHTLCRYHLKETSRLIYESFARYLVEHKGYDKDLLNLTPATWDFCFKGLVVDLEDGNIVKLAEDGTVLRATHGTNNLSTEELMKHYGPKREWKHFNSLNTSFTRSAKYYFYDNYFDLPGALLCGKVVDMLHKRGNEVNSNFWKDMLAAIDHNYNTSAFKVALWNIYRLEANVHRLEGGANNDFHRGFIDLNPESGTKAAKGKVTSKPTGRLMRNTGTTVNTCVSILLLHGSVELLKCNLLMISGEVQD